MDGRARYQMTDEGYRVVRVRSGGALRAVRAGDRAAAAAGAAGEAGAVTTIARDSNLRCLFALVTTWRAVVLLWLAWMRWRFW